MAHTIARASADARLARLYSACLRSADWASAHRRVTAAIGAALALAVIVTINQWVLLDFPNSGDEYAYRYQAQTLAAGRLWNPPVAAPEIFDTSYIVQASQRRFSSFPLGWPLLLATAFALRFPPWLVNAVLGVVTLGLVWALGARLYAPRIGVIAAAIVGVSPFFAFNAASYFSHTLCGALLLGAACLAAREDRTRWWVPASIGLLLGWAILTRYFTGVICAAPIVLWLLRPGVPRARACVLVAAGGLPWIAVLMAYNLALAGDPFQLTTTPLTRSLWFADGVLLRGADILATHLVRHLWWTPPALVIAYAVYLRTAPSQLRRGALDWLLIVMAVGLYAYMERGGNQYGPRFHYEVFPFLVVFVVANVFAHDDFAAKGRRDRLWFGGLAASVAVMPIFFAIHALIEGKVIRERMDPYTLASAAGLQEALVLISGRIGTARSMGARDLTRNGVDHDGSVLYGLDPGEAERCAPVVRAYGRTTYLYAWDAAASRGVLEPVRCPG